MLFAIHYKTILKDICNIERRYIMAKEFLLDENILGLDRYLKNHVTFRKVGDNNCPSKESDDPDVVKYAKEHNLVIVTNDEKMKKQCDVVGIECILNDLTTVAKRVIEYSDKTQAS